MSAVGGAGSASGPGSAGSSASSFAHEDHHGDSAGASAAHRDGPHAGAGTHDDGRTSAERHASGRTTSEQHAGAQTTSERHAGEPTTAERLGGGADGSREAAEAGSRNASATGTSSWQSDHRGVDGRRTDGTAALSGGVNLAAAYHEKAFVNEIGSHVRHDALGELSHTSPAERELVARQIQAPLTTAAKARDLLPEGSPARWVGVLDDVGGITKTVGKATERVGYWAGPALGAVQGLSEAGPQATWGQRIASVIGGAAREADDAYFAGKAGIEVGAMLGGANPVAVIGGMSAGIAVAHAYEGSQLDVAFDHFVDTVLEPTLADGIDRDLAMIDAGWNQVRSLFQGGG